MLEIHSENKAVHGRITKLTGPIILQNLPSAAVNSADVVPLGFLAAAALKLPPLWVYFLLCTDEFVKRPWAIGHYRSRKWLQNITRENVLDE